MQDSSWAAMPELLLETGEVFMTLLQLLALIQDDTFVVLVDANGICDILWRNDYWRSRACVLGSYPSDEASWSRVIQSKGGDPAKTLAIVYMHGGAAQHVSRTAKIVDSFGGRAVILACCCNWQLVPEDVVAMRSHCSGRDVFGVLLPLLTEDPVSRSYFFQAHAR